jgi:CheY-like chemotaxis protein
MPIVDGLASTKLIRSFESTHSSDHLSSRASLNGRVPIIAVSASLVEKERETYMNAGFDGWILKPISFSRLSELMHGIVGETTREQALYAPGQWEKGGWFTRAQPERWKSEGAAGAGQQAPEGVEDGTVKPATDGVLTGEQNEPVDKVGIKFDDETTPTGGT